MARRDDGGLGTHLLGDKIPLNNRVVQVSKLIGEGTFLSMILLETERSPVLPRWSFSPLSLSSHCRLFRVFGVPAGIRISSHHCCCQTLHHSTHTFMVSHPIPPLTCCECLCVAAAAASYRSVPPRLSLCPPCRNRNRRVFVRVPREGHFGPGRVNRFAAKPE